MKTFKNFNLTEYNSYRLNAFCNYAFFPETEQDVLDIFKSKKKFVLIGNGNNIILSKEHYDKEFVIFNGNFNKISIDSNVIIAESGATTLNLSKYAEKCSLTGAEFFYDIPSSIGGAVVMNAGTKEGKTQKILKKVRYLDLKDNKIKERFSDDLQLDYRNSMFQKEKDKIILKAWFKLNFGDRSEIRQMMDESKTRRWSKQPREFPNCGSVFKRPPGRFVGPMLDELGLKGLTVGGAQVSHKHSGFIVNFKNASGSDILELIQIIQFKVKDCFGINLEVEQRII
tara:strand:+ start:201 stop:1052 length:852 start_codon:yes stop_codon:yes gene_type:complete